jgi:long-chain fatty acid transport protein
MKAITVDFEDPSLSQNLLKRWHDTVNFHLGGEYRWSPALALRLGAVYDPTPSPLDTLTPDLPDSNRLKITAGAGYTHERFHADVG